MEPIAIVGMACRFPRAPSLSAYWDLLVDGIDAVREPPADRPELEPPPWLFEYAPSCSRGGFLEGLDRFEPSFFRLSPREAARMDPQQRLLLEVAWEALEDAGQPSTALAGTSTGVFVGIMNADFARRHAQNLQELDAQLGPGSSLGIAPNRLSFVLDLQGPSLAVDTLCSSSLMAVHLACQSLRADESSPLALAGGVNVILDRAMDVFYARAGLLSADGRCRSFDAGARGIVRGEGAGVVVLKRLSRAIADRDRIHAVILGSAVNQDGRSNGLTSPSRWSQERVLRAAYRQAGITPNRVSYVESHGTGTLIGDPIEAAALAAVIGEGRPADRPCALGSVKTNLGHLESAAGIAGLMKAALSLSKRTIPPNLNFQSPNPYAHLEQRGLYVPTKARAWPDHGDGPLVTGVSSFGMGGTNAHVVLGAADDERESSVASVAKVRALPRAALVAVSARSLPALAALRHSTAQILSDEQADLADVAYSTGARRTHHDHRRATVAASAEQAASQLRGEEGTSDTTASGRAVPGQRYKLVFVLPQDTTCSADSGRELAAQEPVFQAAMQRCQAALREQAVAAPTAVAHLFAFQVALAALWRHWGFEPDAVVGVGSGAIAARHVGGSLTLEEAAASLASSVSASRIERELLVASLGEAGTVLLELSPSPLLQGELRAVLEASQGAALASLLPGLGERASVLRAVAELYCMGFAVDWSRLSPETARFVPLGTYPWQRERCWLDPAPQADRPREKEAAASLEAALVPRWERMPRSPLGPTDAEPGPWLLLGQGGGGARALAARLEQAGHDTRSIAEGLDGAQAWERLLAERSWRGIVCWFDGATASSPVAELARAAGYLGATIHLLQEIARRGSAPLPRLWLVTRGAQVVGEDTSLPCLARATVWGLGRVVANEYPRLKSVLVDLPPTEREREDAEALMGELRSDANETEVAFRGSERFVGRLERRPLFESSPRPKLRPDAAYLITGGLGGLGLAAARLLVERGARRIVLLGRRGVTTDVQRSAIAEMIAAGASVTVEQVDVAERPALQSMLLRNRGVRGVIHAAGVMSPAMLATLDPETLAAMISSKALGALHLHELTSSAAEPLDFFVLYSSVATLLGTPGQAAYAAANAYLDVLAQHRQAVGLSATSIAWTVIAGTGMAARASARAVSQLAERGLGSLSVHDATKVLEHILSLPAPPPRLGVAPFDLRRWTAFYPRTGSSPRLAPLSLPSTGGAESAAGAPPYFGAQLRSMARPERTAALEDFLCGKLAEVLQHPASQLERTRSLADLGLDSLMAVELQSLVEAELGIELLVERLVAGPTLLELADEVSRAMDSELADASVPVDFPPLRADAQLEPRLARSIEPGAPPPSQPRELLLTGATGFLGAFLLSEILARTDAKIHCLVRATSSDEGLRRLEAVLARYELSARIGESVSRLSAKLSDRVVCIPGDLGQPRLGLDADTFARLARSLDTVVHSGASVNFILPYEALKPANVQGTQEVLRLAASGGPKRLHYVSTIGVFPGGSATSEVLENERSQDPERLTLGYMRAKWVAEELVTLASARGLATSVYRPGTISGHGTTGVFNPDDFLCALIKGCVQMGMAPRVDVPVNLAPVDYVSQAIVRIAFGSEPPSGAYHLVSPVPVAWNELVGWLRQLGYPLVEAPYERWRRHLLESALPTGNALAPLLPLFADRADTNWLNFPRFDAARTEQALARSGVVCPPVDLMLIRRYVERFVASGFLSPSPGLGGGREHA